MAFSFYFIILLYFISELTLWWFLRDETNTILNKFFKFVFWLWLFIQIHKIKTAHHTHTQLQIHTNSHDYYFYFILLFYNSIKCKMELQLFFLNFIFSYSVWARQAIHCGVRDWKELNVKETYNCLRTSYAFQSFALTFSQIKM